MDTFRNNVADTAGIVSLRLSLNDNVDVDVVEVEPFAMLGDSSPSGVRRFCTAHCLSNACGENALLLDVLLLCVTSVSLLCPESLLARTGLSTLMIDARIGLGPLMALLRDRSTATTAVGLLL